MGKSVPIVALVAALAVAGCATQAQFLDTKQAMAIHTAVVRGQFEMNCPTATGSVLSREVIQPAIQGPWVGGLERAEFTVGVSGCEQRGVYTVICPMGGEGCFAVGSRQ